MSAKEGGRTPTRVTSLEPEGRAPTGNPQTLQLVTGGTHRKVRLQNAAGNSKPPQDNGACTGIDPATFGFPVDCVVEVARGDAKGSRGVVKGCAPTAWLGIPDLAVRMESGVDRWIGPDMLRRIG